jgi:hypothetical protein
MAVLVLASLCVLYILQYQAIHKKQWTFTETTYSGGGGAVSPVSSSSLSTVAGGETSDELSRLQAEMRRLRASMNGTAPSSHLAHGVASPPGGARVYVVISSSDPVYNFFLPLTCKLWLRFGIQPIVMLEPRAALLSPTDEFVIKELDNVGVFVHYLHARESDRVTFIQTSRLFGYLSTHLRDDDYLITTDVDIWPGQRDFFINPLVQQPGKELYVLNMPSKKKHTIPMCYVAATARHWAKLMNVTRRTSRGYLRDISKTTWDALDRGKAKYERWGTERKGMKRNFQWSYDQILLTDRIEVSGMCPRPHGGKTCHVARVKRRHPKKDKWFHDTAKRFADVHVAKPGWADRNWAKSLNYYAGLFGPDGDGEAKEREWAEWYRITFLRRLAVQKKKEVSDYTKLPPSSEDEAKWAAYPGGVPPQADIDTLVHDHADDIPVEALPRTAAEKKMDASAEASAINKVPLPPLFPTDPTAAATATATATAATAAAATAATATAASSGGELDDTSYGHPEDNHGDDEETNESVVKAVESIEKGGDIGTDVSDVSKATKKKNADYKKPRRGQIKGGDIGDAFRL